MEQCPQQYKINEICRCCLKNIGEMRPLYGFSLNEMLRSVTNLDVTPNDGFPELLCFQCVLQLSRAYRFKEQCIKSNKIIFDYIQGRTAKKDPIGSAIIDNTFQMSECVLPEDSHSDDNSVSLYDQHSNERNIEEFCREPCKGKLQNLGRSPEEENKDAYKCDICYKQFSSRKQLTRHMKTHNDNKTYKCTECHKTFAEKCNLNKHMYKHSGELRNATNKVYLCSICGKKFKYSSSLAKHMKFHTGRDLLYCSDCPKSFAEKSALQIHQRIHTGDRPYVCQQCNRRFTQLCNLRKHLRCHKTEKIFACSICEHTFVDRNYLAVHMKTHSLGKQSLCSLCGKAFANDKTLEAHMRVHDEKRLFECGLESCNKTFSRNDTAVIHRRIHSGDKPYSCKICNNAFTTSTQLSVHSKSHSSEKSFTCGLCEQKFTTKSGLGKHTLSHRNITPLDADVQQNVEVAGHTFEESVLLFNFQQSSYLVSKTEPISQVETIRK